MKSMTWRARIPREEDIPDPLHDGDTIWLETDQGDWDRKVRACRFYEVFAPELKDPGGPETREQVVKWIKKHAVGKWPLWVDTVQTTTGLDAMTFNRFVTIIWNKDRTSQLNAEISAFVLANGYGRGTGGG